MTTHLLTFDIEEWFHLVGVRAMDDRAEWDTFERTVEPLTDELLTLLDEHQTHATFFMLGWVAERYPALVRRIAAMGHELASHSHAHYEVYKHTPQTFREDLRRSVRAIEDVSGQHVLGYRAPSFSLTPGCEWAWDVMLDEGLAYDASVFPTARSHGGYPLPSSASDGPAFKPVPTPSGRTIEVLPMSTMQLPLIGKLTGRWAGKRLAFSGGGYFRVWPWWLVQRGFAQHDVAGRSAVLYLHPWDFAAGGPSLPMRRHQKFKCYFHRGQTERRLRELLNRYRFDACRSVLDRSAVGYAAAA